MLRRSIQAQNANLKGQTRGDIKLSPLFCAGLAPYIPKIILCPSYWLHFYDNVVRRIIPVDTNANGK